MSEEKRGKGAEMPFLEHLEVLRGHLIRMVSAILIVAIVIFVFRKEVFSEVIFAQTSIDFITYEYLCKLSHWVNSNIGDWVMDPDTLCIDEFKFKIQDMKPAGEFVAAMLVALIGGIIISFPYLVWEVWRFIRPALHNKEQKAVNGLIFSVSALFLGGISFGYFVIAPLSINFFGTFTNHDLVNKNWTQNSFMGIITSTTLASGIMFQLPVLVYFLSKMGLITPEGMKKYRKHAIIVVLVLSAIITPPDVFSQILVTIPIFILYELSIFIARFVVKKDAQTS